MAQGIDDLLRLAVEKKASDLHLKVGNNPYLRIDGTLVALAENTRVTPEEMLSMAFSMMTNRQKQKFKETAELDMAYGVAAQARYSIGHVQFRRFLELLLLAVGHHAERHGEHLFRGDTSHRGLRGEKAV